MSRLSSETLFHFTKKEHLLSILENEFYPRYSLEEFKINRVQFKLGIPMVSFCDIPLGLIQEHIEDYGHYGIGMSKGWAKRKRLNPVLYLDENSELSWLINNVLKLKSEDIKAMRELGVKIDSETELYRELLKVLRYAKIIEGSFKRNGIDRIKKFYDEREWRYVPDNIIYNSPYLVIREDEYKAPLLQDENEKLKKAKLSFEPNDINYIIIEDESEREDILENINNIKWKYEDRIRKVLLSKIISSKSIFVDF
jgi:hypothetical protein